MTLIVHPFQPDWASAPGETIEELLENRGLSATDFATFLDRTPDFVAGLLVGAERIDAGLASALAKVFSVSAQFWLNRDAHYVDDCKRLGLTPGRTP